VNPQKGTIKKGTAVSPWTRDSIDGAYIKSEAQAGRMGEQLVAVGIKDHDGLSFRSPNTSDQEAFERAKQEYYGRQPSWDAANLIPNEPRKAGRADWACEIYGARHWSDTYSIRQLFAMVMFLECMRDTVRIAASENARDRAAAIQTYLALALDKAADYNSKQVGWDVTRRKIAHAFTRHDLSMRWSFAEFDAGRVLAPWAVDQVVDAYIDVASLAELPSKDLFGESALRTIDRLQLSQGKAQSLSAIPAGSIRVITVDPPYYDNVNYAECSNYFYVWMKRTLGDLCPSFFATELANEDDEAVMNVARFKDMGRKAKPLAIADYENKMQAAFTEMNRVLAHDGILTVMFTHKEVDAWDTLGSSLIRAGFQIDSSWPVHTESEKSLHQAKKNAAASTILLVCRKREEASEPVWWDDLKNKVRERAREKAEEFEQAGICGVDLYISTFGPVLSIISEHWPVLTSQSDSKGSPIPLKPGDSTWPGKR
jgi:adenine-specific DNA methylase